MGLRADEAVGRSLLALDIGLPMDVLTPHLRGLPGWAGDGSPALELAAVNRRGKTVGLQVRASPLTSAKGAVCGVILVIDGAPAREPRD